MHTEAVSAVLSGPVLLSHGSLGRSLEHFRRNVSSRIARLTYGSAEGRVRPERVWDGCLRPSRVGLMLAHFQIWPAPPPSPYP